MAVISTPSPPHRGGRASLASAVLLWLAVASLAAAEPIPFTFNPPVPLTWKETVKTTRTDPGPQGTRREFVTIERSIVELVRSDEGYLMTVRPETLRQLRNKREIKIPGSPMEELAQKGVLTYALDANGGLVSVSGHLEIVLRLQSLFYGLVQQTPDERRPQLAAAAYAVTQKLEPEAILGRMQTEWGARVSSLAGVRMEIGEILVSDTRFALPDHRTIPTFTALRLEEVIEGRPGPRARLTYHFDSDASALKDFAGSALKETGAASPSDTRVRGSGERIIDPSTLLIISETQNRSVTVNAPGPDGKPVPVTREEAREYTYEYLPAPAID